MGYEVEIAYSFFGSTSDLFRISYPFDLEADIISVTVEALPMVKHSAEMTAMTNDFLSLIGILIL